MTRFNSCKVQYTSCQSDIIDKAVQIAATYVPVLRRIAHIIGKNLYFTNILLVGCFYDCDGRSFLT